MSFYDGGARPIASPTPVPASYPTPTPITNPFEGSALVRVTPAGRPKDSVAEQETHDSDWVSFHLPPGQYWVFVPKDHQTTLASGNWLVENPLPDLATEAYAGAEITVPRNGSVDVTLIVNYLGS